MRRKERWVVVAAVAQAQSCCRPSGPRCSSPTCAGFLGVQVQWRQLGAGCWWLLPPAQASVSPCSSPLLRAGAARLIGDDCFGVGGSHSQHPSHSDCCFISAKVLAPDNSTWWGGGAMVARLTPDQKVASSILVLLPFCPYPFAALMMLLLCFLLLLTPF